MYTKLNNDRWSSKWAKVVHPYKNHIHVYNISKYIDVTYYIKFL